MGEPAIVIRPAREADLAAINRIYNDEILHGTATWDEAPWTADQRAEWFRSHDERTPVLVAEREGVLAGFAYLSLASSKSGWRFSREDTIYIDAPFRGQGVGWQLLSALLAEAKRLGLNLIIASITSDNAASLALHRNAGFEVVGTHRQAGFKFGRWLDTTLMQRVLNDDPPAAATFRFEPLTREHFPLLCRWFNTPHVYEWWGREVTSDGLGGPGDLATTVEEVEARYGAAADGNDTTHHFVVEVDGRPLGFVQWYRLSHEPDYASEIREPGDHVAGIDYLIGEADAINRGLGSAMIERFVADVVFAAKGISRVVAGPDVRNGRSIRALEKAGFHFVRDAAVTGEPAPERILARER